MTDPRDLFPVEDDEQEYEPAGYPQDYHAPYEYEEDDPNDHITQDMIMGNR
jgi:hypothetical protein